MDKKIIGIYGAGGFGSEVFPLLKEYCKSNDLKGSICFIDAKCSKDEFCGVPVMSEESFFDLKAEEKFFVIAIGDSKARSKISAKCASKGVKPLSLVALNASIVDKSVIGEGALICGFSSVTSSNIRIGKYFHSNIYSYIAHDCVIGDYVTFAPRVNCNGNVHIHDHAYIGTGAVIKQGREDKPLVVGEGAIVGMGAVVTKDVEPYTIVVGNPAKPLEKR